MSDINFRGVQNISNLTKNYLPEPASRGVGFLRDTMKVLGRVASAASPMDFNSIASFNDLIQRQMQAQREMQQTSMVSNIEKSKHETRMSPIRNIRVS